MKVLVVHPDPVAAAAYKAALEQAGDQAATAFDLATAMVAVAEFGPEAIVVDVRATGPAGLVLMDDLRGDDRTRDLPLVIVSDFSESDLAALGFRLGARDSIVRSVNRFGSGTAGL